MANSGTEIQLNPPLQPPGISQAPPVDSYANYHLYSYGNPNYSLHYAHSQNPNPFPDHHHHHFPGSIVAAQIQPPPPGYDPAPPGAANPHANSYVYPPGYEAPQLGLAYSSYQTVAAAPAEYQDPIQNVALTSAGVNLYGAGVIVPSTGMQNLASAQAIGSQRSNFSKKAPKKIKIVQSVWCEVCKVDCNSKNVLDQHKLGKKHKKNLEKLIVANKSLLVPSSVSAPVPTASTVSANLIIGPQENPGKAKLAQENPVKVANCASSQIEQNKAAGADDLETKKGKMLKEGAAADAVRTCAVCNVVCNSETVFKYHLAGQKHASKVRKHVNATKIGC